MSAQQCHCTVLDNGCRYCQPQAFIDDVLQQMEDMRDEHARELGELRTHLMEVQLTADCLHMLRSDLIEAGIVDKGCAPMFLTEGIFAYLQGLKRHE